MKAMTDHIEAGAKQHDWVPIWFGIHVQEECRTCKQLRTAIYETGEELDHPSPVCIAQEAANDITVWKTLIIGFSEEAFASAGIASAAGVPITPEYWREFGYEKCRRQLIQEVEEFVKQTFAEGSVTICYFSSSKPYFSSSQPPFFLRHRINFKNEADRVIFKMRFSDLIQSEEDFA